MESLITILIVIIVVVVQARRAIREQRQARGGVGEDGWWEEETPSSPAPPPAPARSGPPRPPPPAAPARPRPTPSPQVRDILRQLQEQVQGRVAQEAQPPEPAKPAPERRYIDEEAIEAKLSQAARETAEQAAKDIYSQSAACAFAIGHQVVRQSRASQRPPIRLRSRTRASLRQAILLGEALNQPRTFDV